MSLTEYASRYDKPHLMRRTAGWDIGERPLVPIPHIKLPTYTFVHAHQRDNHFDSRRDNFSSRPIAAGGESFRERQAAHQREGQGWRSKLHKAIDYRTVDELGLKPEELALDRKPKRAPEKLVVVEDQLRRQEGPEDVIVHIDLVPGNTEHGHVREREFRYYRIYVPRRTSLALHLVTISGDPDMYVCNRFPNPHQTQHSWKSAGIGDDLMDIQPDDPLFYPGYFYIGVYGAKESTFDLTANTVRERVHVHDSIRNTEGNGYKDLRERIIHADTRRRFCINGVGFKEQIDSPRSLRASTIPPAPTSARGRPPAAEESSPLRPATSRPSSACPARPFSAVTQICTSREAMYLGTADSGRGHLFGCAEYEAPRPPTAPLQPVSVWGIAARSQSSPAALEEIDPAEPEPSCRPVEKPARSMAHDSSRSFKPSSSKSLSKASRGGGTSGPATATPQANVVVTAQERYSLVTQTVRKATPLAEPPPGSPGKVREFDGKSPRSRQVAYRYADPLLKAEVLGAHQEAGASMRSTSPRRPDGGSKSDIHAGNKWAAHGAEPSPRAGGGAGSPRKNQVGLARRASCEKNGSMSVDAMWEANDEEKDVFEVIRSMLAEVYHVTEQTLDDRNEIGFRDRVVISKGEFQCLQKANSCVVAPSPPSHVGVIHGSPLRLLTSRYSPNGCVQHSMRKTSRACYRIVVAPKQLSTSITALPAVKTSIE